MEILLGIALTMTVVMVVLWVLGIGYCWAMGVTKEDDVPDALALCLAFSAIGTILVWIVFLLCSIWW